MLAPLTESPAAAIDWVGWIGLALGAVNLVAVLYLNSKRLQLQTHIKDEVFFRKRLALIEDFLDSAWETQRLMLDIVNHQPGTIPSDAKTKISDQKISLTSDFYKLDLYHLAPRYRDKVEKVIDHVERFEDAVNQGDINQAKDLTSKITGSIETVVTEARQDFRFPPGRDKSWFRLWWE